MTERPSVLRRVMVAALVLAAMGATAAPRAGAGRTPAAPVTILDRTFVDDTRPTAANGSTPASDERELPTTIAYPTRPKQPLPLVVLAHGFPGNPGKFTELIDAWAHAGYVVAAPQFPLTNDVTSATGSAGDVVNQPADITFVIDQMLQLNDKKGNALRDRIDRRRIGLAGLSLGGLTAYGAVFNSCCHDDRIDAAILMSAVYRDFPDGSYERRSVPALLVDAEIDFLRQDSVAAYPALTAPKFFVTLHGAAAPGVVDVVRHASPFEDAPDAADELVRRVTTAFLDRYLKGERKATRRLITAAQPADGSATVEYEE